MNIDVELDKLKRQLGIADDEQDPVLEDLLEDWSAIACDICNRRDPTPTMLAIIRDTAAAAFHRRGGEGMSGYDTGQQSYSFETLRDECYQRLIQAGQRVYA